MSSLIEQAQGRGVTAAAQMVETEPLIAGGHVKAGDLNLSVKNMYVNHRTARVSTLLPQSQPTNGLASGSFSDIRIAGGQSCRGLIMSLTIKNNSTTDTVSLTTDKVFDCLSYVEVLFENGALPVVRIDADHLKLALSDLDSDSYRNVVAAIQGGPPGAGADILPGGSHTCLVPVFKFFPAEFKIAPDGLNNPLIIRTWFNGGCPLHTEGCTLSDFSALYEYWAYDKSVSDRLVRQMRTSRMDWRFASPVVMSVQETITPGTRFDLRLSSLTGLVQSLVIILKIAGVAVPIAQLELTDQSGTNLNGGSMLSHAYVSTLVRARENKYYPALGEPASEADNYFHVPIAVNASKSEEQGQLNGYMVFSGLEQVRFVYNSPDGSTTPVPVEISVLYSSSNIFTVAGGAVSVAKS